MQLAGGFCRGDRVSYDGRDATVVGLPGRPAAAGISVAVRFDDGHTHDVRVASLARVDGRVQEASLRAVQVKPTPFDGEALPTRPESGTRTFAPPSRRTLAKQPSRSAKERALDEVKPPQLYVTGAFPTQNFRKYVVEKDPTKDEHDAPDTQTILSKKAGYHQVLPTDPIERQKELVRVYTMETQLYPQMNLALRQDDAKRLKYFGAYIKELRDVFYTDQQDQIITPYLGTAYRGITVPDVNQYLKDFQPGAEFVWEAFTSTTSDKTIAKMFGNLLFEIHCNEPVTGTFDDDTPEFAPADIRPFSDTKEETEILFPPNVRFRVITIKLPTGQLGSDSMPIVICETLGYDSIWGLIDAGNHHEVKQFLEERPHLVNGDAYSHSILHHAVDSGDASMTNAVLDCGANLDQVCHMTGLTAREKLAGGAAQSDGPSDDGAPPGGDREGRQGARQSLAVPAISPPIRAGPGTHRVVAQAPMGLDEAGRSQSRPSTSRTSHETLAGGYYKGDRVVSCGDAGTVIGPPARRACAAISVAVRFDTGFESDVRVANLTPEA
mmetsp:Transcript_82436/g.229742  ORF Transcript_82436/g.229742 Transcript_82436/m.229742 type:complete len:552 (-) Transcript_82436:90-1745(-)